ncbi:MAG: metallophosphoesterase [Myxococcales bacterium]
MRIQLLSDLHFEFQRDAGRGLVEVCYEPDVDVLILAGDIAVAGGIEPALTQFSERYPRVLYVHGNHEFYTSNRESVLAHTRQACERLGNVSFLDCETVEIEGRRFHGAPLWYRETDDTQRLAQYLNDFRVIADYRSWVYREHARAREFLETQVGPGDVVITHHLPSYACVVPEYQDHPLNCFFVSDMEHVMRQRRPALWCHGHTHGSVDMTFESTRVLCNPYGYARREENADFEPRLVVEI